MGELYKIEKRKPDGSWKTILDDREDRAIAQVMAEHAAARGNVMRLVEKSTGKVLWQA